MRLVMKGGLWKNAEDEVLKAAVMKYGLNNWSRVASLLVRKTARQCKSRWYEWLDPSVKKVPWSKSEDERLLHLARLFPTQWKTVAASVGRTAIQCVERYNELLDMASGRPTDLGETDPRKLRPGEIDPNPEAKPARADAVDLDDDEKEMLAEARARLANTRGKKAKRKARERQLEEARRVAMLQKRRELKAAGITTGLSSGVKRRRQEIDYEHEVPFEHKPNPGFHAVGLEETPDLTSQVANMRLQQMEMRQAQIREKRMRAQDRRALKKLHDQDLPSVMERVAAVTDPFSVRNRSQLSLPAPQVTETELETLAQATQAVSRGTGVLESLSELLRGVEGTNSLLQQTQLTAIPSAMDTPVSTGAGLQRQAAIMEGARTALSLQQAQTPLVGGETTVAPLAPAPRPVKKRRVASSLTATPMTITTEASAPDGATPVASRRDKKAKAWNILEELMAPSNQVSLGVDVASGESESEADATVAEEEDAQDRESRVRKRREQLLEELLRVHARACMFREHLPRPLVLPADNMQILPGGQPYDDLVEEQMRILLRGDEKFLRPEVQMQMYTKPTAMTMGPELVRGFLAFAAKQFQEISFSSLKRAAALIESMAAQPESVSVESEAWPPAELGNSSVGLVILEEELSGGLCSESNSKLIAAVGQELDKQLRDERIICDLRRKRLQKLREKSELLHGGYRKREAELLHQLDSRHREASGVTQTSSSVA